MAGDSLAGIESADGYWGARSNGERSIQLIVEKSKSQERRSSPAQILPDAGQSGQCGFRF